MILYTGKRPYTYSTDIFELFGNNKELAKDILYKPYQLIDLQKIPDEEFKLQLWFGVMARIMKHIYKKDIIFYLRETISKLKDIETQGDTDYTYKIITYLFEAGEVIDQNEFIETITNGLSVDEEKIMTLAQIYRAEGEQAGVIKGRLEGIAKGKLEGKQAAIRKMAIKMLNQGIPVQQVAQLTEVSEQELTILLVE